MIRKLRKKVGKILCYFMLHKARWTDGCNVAGGMHCAREECDWKIDPIEWPMPPENE